MVFTLAWSIFSSGKFDGELVLFRQPFSVFTLFPQITWKHGPCFSFSPMPAFLVYKQHHEICEASPCRHGNLPLSFFKALGCTW